MKKILSEKFDEAFDSNEDVSKYLDKKHARRKHEEVKRVNIDFPVWVIGRLDEEARRLGVTRQSLVKMWIAERIDRVHEKNNCRNTLPQFRKHLR